MFRILIDKIIYATLQIPDPLMCSLLTRCQIFLIGIQNKLRIELTYCNAMSHELISEFIVTVGICRSRSRRLFLIFFFIVYVVRPFRTWEIVSLWSFLSLVALSSLSSVAQQSASNFCYLLPQGRQVGNHCHI